MSTASCAPWWMGALSQHLHRPFVICPNLDIHVPQFGVHADKHMLHEHTLARVLSVGTALVQPARPRARSVEANVVSRTPTCGMLLVGKRHWTLGIGTRLGKDHGLPEEVYSEGEDAWNCQPLPFNGLGTVPLLSSAAAGRVTKPWWSRDLAASCHIPKQNHGNRRWDKMQHWVRAYN